MIVPILTTENSQQLANEEKEDFLQQEESEGINEKKIQKKTLKKRMKTSKKEIEEDEDVLR